MSVKWVLGINKIKYLFLCLLRKVSMTWSEIILKRFILKIEFWIGRNIERKFGKKGMLWGIYGEIWKLWVDIF